VRNPLPISTTSHRQRERLKTWKRLPTHADYPIHSPAIPSQRKLQILRPLQIPKPTGGREDGLDLRGMGRREIDPHEPGDGGERRGGRRRRGWGIYGGWNAAADL
jgi:hypothetical protein